MPKRSTSRVNDLRTPAPKKPYRTPRLTEYGHIAKLTAGTTGSATDKGVLANVHGMGWARILNDFSLFLGLTRGCKLAV